MAQSPWIVMVSTFSDYIMALFLRWLRIDLAKQAGQSFVTAQLPTGYFINRDAIMDMYHYQDVPGLKRVRFRDDTLILIFEYVSFV